MKRLLFTWVLVLGFSSCAALPNIHVLDQSEGEALSRICLEVFPKGKWQFIHAITADFPGGFKSGVIGISTFDSRAKSIHAVILSQEGLRLFEGVKDQTVRVQYALPPFDKQYLAEGLMQDIAAIFFPPEAEKTMCGRFPGGSQGCRWEVPGRGSTDIILQNQTSRILRKYNQNNRIKKTVHFMNETERSPKPAFRFERLQLEVRGPGGYTLQFKLIKAIPVSNGPMK